MELSIFADVTELARSAAKFVADKAREAVDERGRFVLALSGGSTPWKMIEALSKETVPWQATHILQVDERVAPEGHEDRNLTHLLSNLAQHAKIPAGNIHPMPVNEASLATACTDYAQTIATLTGDTMAVDLVHLGLGGDGHTASLVPDDEVLTLTDVAVATTAPYQGTTRMTLTYPTINAAHNIMWLVTGAGKSAMVERLLAGDEQIPAGRVNTKNARLFVDNAARPVR